MVANSVLFCSVFAGWKYSFPSCLYGRLHGGGSKVTSWQSGDPLHQRSKQGGFMDACKYWYGYHWHNCTLNFLFISCCTQCVYVHATFLHACALVKSQYVSDTDCDFDMPVKCISVLKGQRCWWSHTQIIDNEPSKRMAWTRRIACYTRSRMWLMHSSCIQKSCHD